MRAPAPQAVILMGVTGSGKTTIGKLLARDLGCRFFDADDYHPAGNIKKMRAGIPLTDEDRLPWLDRLCSVIRDELRAGRSLVLACSALRERYRERLSQAELIAGQIRFVLLQVSAETAIARVRGRQDHYMPPTLVQSQFDTLEPPASAMIVDAESEAAEVARQIKSALALKGAIQ